MKCEQVQRRLLAGDAPAQPSAETRRHLADCPSCRVWQRRLVELEQQLPMLATPLSERKAEVIRQFLDAPEATINGIAPPYTPLLPFTTPPRERGLRKASLAIAMAAGLAVFALGWWAWQLQSVDTPKPDPLKPYREERDRLLAQAPTRQAKVEALATLAEKHHEAALKLAQQGDADNLANTAKFYIELVSVNLVEQANELDTETPPGKRPVALAVVADQLERTESLISGQLGNPAVKFTNRTRADLEQMAKAARESRDQLRGILYRENRG